MSSEDETLDATVASITRTVFVSDALQARLDDYCGDGDDATGVLLAAIEHFGGELAELVRGAHAQLAWTTAQDAPVRYLGAGPVQVRLCPGAAGARLMDRLSTQVGLPYRTWVPALLNAYLPGRREPDNMPWLVHDRGMGQL